MEKIKVGDKKKEGAKIKCEGQFSKQETEKPHRQANEGGRRENKMQKQTQLDRQTQSSNSVPH